LGFFNCFDVLDEVPADRVQVEGRCLECSLAFRGLPMGYRGESTLSDFFQFSKFAMMLSSVGITLS
jgi:hypothetical protein